MTLRQPLRVQHVKPRVWAVEGTPVDCIYFALQKFLPRRPDLIISGMNPGPNLGQQDINYSGTVAGAIQGTFHGIPSMAVSLLPGRRGPLRPEVRRGGRRDDRGRHPRRTACRRGRPSTSISRRAPIKGVKITRLGWKFYDPEIIEKTDPRNSSYYWIGTGTPRRVGDAGTDVMAAHAGYISLTPLHTDMTAHHALRSEMRRIARPISGPKRWRHPTPGVSVAPDRAARRRGLLLAMPAGIPPRWAPSRWR